MNYQVFEPSPELQPFVKCFWTLEADASGNPVKQRVVPDGCMEMIFHYGDLFRQYFENGSFVIQPRCFVFGQITNFLEIEPTGVTGVVSARFHPDGLLPFINVPVKVLENKATCLYALFGDNGKTLEEDVLSKNTNAERIKVIEEFLLTFLQLRPAIDKITKSCVDVILHSPGQINLDKLAEQLNIDRRTIERKISSAVGISPKQLAKIIRLQASLKMLEKKQFTSLTSLAYENGYYDQAHFIKDFKEFTGISPKLFYADSLKLSALFASAG